MSAVGKTLWLLESRFGETLSLDELAAHAGVSRSHLSRIFPLATGYSISAYVRGRRLTEAAKALADGAPDILAVALDVGYGSHEAFTRAFRDQFELTPDEVRRKRSLSHLQLVEPLRMDTAQTIDLAPPKIVTLPDMRIAGFAELHLMTKPATLPPQWQRFHPYIGNVPGEVLGGAYGIVGPMQEDADSFDYLVGVEIKGNAELPPGFVVWTIPAGKYAKAAHRGHVTSIRSTIRALTEGWLPTSGDRHRHDALAFVEYYGPDFDASTGLGTMEIWVGLE